MEIKKAKSQQQKLQRTNTILEAAEHLFEQNLGSELPSAIQIANQAKVAKGTLYIFFNQRSYIFSIIRAPSSELDRQLRTEFAPI